MDGAILHENCIALSLARLNLMGLFVKFWVRFVVFFGSRQSNICRDYYWSDEYL